MYLTDQEKTAMEYKKRILINLSEEEYKNPEILETLTYGQRLELCHMYPDDAVLHEMVKTIETQPEKKTEPCLKPLSNVEDGEVKWLWEPYIQANNITVLRGDGGVGKSFFSCAVMAAISKDARPFDMPGVIHNHGPVVYFGAEDDDFIIKNRVSGSGGDLSKVYIYNGNFEMADHEGLRQIIKEVGARLVIFDPIQSYLGAGVDMNRANEIRPIMDKLREVARQENCAILIVEHLNKNTNQKALLRGIGSIDIVSASRSVLMIGYHSTEEDTRVCMQIKSNSKRGKPVAFKINSDGLYSWEGETEMTEEEMMAASGIFSKGTNKDVLLEGIRALLKENDDMWYGTAAEMFVDISKLTGTTILTPETIGIRMPSLTPVLLKDGFTWNRSRKSRGMVYEIYKTNDVGCM